MKINYWAKFLPETCYHIYNRSIGKEQMFKEEKNYQYFLQKWWDYLGPYCTTYAYCLVPNHFHFLIKCKNPAPEILILIGKENTIKAEQYLSGKIEYNYFILSQFKRFFNCYSTSYNNEYNRTGSLFQSKFKRIIIPQKVHFKYMLYYIHHNVIHHGLAKEYHLWPHTSYLTYSEIKDSKIAVENVLKIFEDEEAENGLDNFMAFHKEYKTGPRYIRGIDGLNKWTVDR